jgi:hypothetical protein
MTCAGCGSYQPDNHQFCQQCGTQLLDPTDQFGDAEKQVLRQHAQNELSRNTKGLAGYGCLTLWFGIAGIAGLLAIFSFSTSSRPGELIGPLLAGLFWSTMAALTGAAVVKRWRRREYYGKIANNPPAFLPPPPPGLSPIQLAKERQRLMATDRQVTSARLATGHIETSIIRPLPEETRAQHVWIPGLPGFGKSTLMHWMAMQDMPPAKASPSWTRQGIS